MPDAEFSFDLPNGRKIDVGEIRERAKATPGSLVVLSGTLIEGIGNSHSDLDVYCFSDVLPEAAAFGEHNYLGVEEGSVRQFYDYLTTDGLGFDVEYYTWDEFHQITSRLTELHQESLSKTKLLRATLSREEEDLIHKFIIGVVIDGESDLHARHAKHMKPQFCFLKYRNHCGGYPEFKDILGAYTAEDWDTCLHLTREYLIDHAMALTFMTEDSNAKKKWIMRKLARLPGATSTLGDRIRTWLVEGASTDDGKRRRVHAAIELVDEVFREIASRLGQLNGSYDLDEARRLTEAEYRLETFHDVQTEKEFDHRRRQFDPAAPTLLSHLQ